MRSMTESGTPPTLAQRCNHCWEEANGSCFRTQCGHLFCESCAFQHFGQSQSCPACGVVLEEADIYDLTLGLAPSHFRSMMFQRAGQRGKGRSRGQRRHAPLGMRNKVKDVSVPGMLRGLQEIYKDTDYRSVAQSVVKTAMALTESMAFVLAQLSLEGQRAAESVAQLKEDLAKQRHENGRLTMQLRNQGASVEQKLREADHKLRLREKELLDLQEAYKEKGRKCQAWEKAYAHLRSQTTDRNARPSGGFTPPESPRISAMRSTSATFGVHDSGRGAGVAGSLSQQRGAGGVGARGSSMHRLDDRLRASTSGRSEAFLGRTDDSEVRGGGGGVAGGGSWSMSRPSTSRGPPVDPPHPSPVLRPRQQRQAGYTHSVTPSPTLTSQDQSGHFAPKRPETPLAVRGYYPRTSSPSNRVSSGMPGTGGGSAVGGLRGGFFQSSKSF